MSELRNKMTELTVVSTVDGTSQPNLFWEADNSTSPKPLIVGLHTWTADRFNQVDAMLPWAMKLGWNLLLPEFRGMNTAKNPNCRLACGSHEAKQDIIDAVEYVKANYNIDAENIFITGGSGGANMTLLMAGYAPKLWRAAAAFCPTTDLETYYHEKRGNVVGAKYAKDVEACLGGEPCPANYADYIYRSPITYAAQIAQSNTTIFHGVYDPANPSHHSLDLFDLIYTKYPGSRVFLKMFDGHHDMILEWAEEWFKSQLRVPGSNDIKNGELTG